MQDEQLYSRVPSWCYRDTTPRSSSLEYIHTSPWHMAHGYVEPILASLPSNARMGRARRYGISYCRKSYSWFFQQVTHYSDFAQVSLHVEYVEMMRGGRRGYLSCPSYRLQSWINWIYRLSHPLLLALSENTSNDSSIPSTTYYQGRQAQVAFRSLAKETWRVGTSDRRSFKDVLDYVTESYDDVK